MKTLKSLVRSFLYVAQDIDQSVGLRQLGLVECDPVVCADCNAQRAAYPQAYPESFCEKICECSMVGASMSSFATINFSASLDSSAVSRIKQAFNADTIRNLTATGDQVDLDSLRNAVDENVNQNISMNDVLQNIMETRVLQKSVQKFALDQKLIQKGGNSKFVTLNIVSDVSAISEVVRGSLTQDEIETINKFEQHVDVIVSTTSSAFELLTSTFFEFLLSFAVCVIFFFAFKALIDQI